MSRSQQESFLYVLFAPAALIAGETPALPVLQLPITFYAKGGGIILRLRRSLRAPAFPVLQLPLTFYAKDGGGVVRVEKYPSSSAFRSSAQSARELFVAQQLRRAFW